MVREIWHRVFGIKKALDLNDRELNTLSILAWGLTQPLRAMLDRRAATIDAEAFSLAAVLPRQLLRAHPELRLEGDIAGALRRGQEPREILLLRFDQGDALLLQAHRVVEQIAYVLLVRLVPATSSPCEADASCRVPEQQAGSSAARSARWSAPADRAERQ